MPGGVAGARPYGRPLCRFGAVRSRRAPVLALRAERIGSNALALGAPPTVARVYYPGAGRNACHLRNGRRRDQWKKSSRMPKV
ncbi:hypothetical protein OKW34_007002 [Paraburkholderia youngii]